MLIPFIFCIESCQKYFKGTSGLSHQCTIAPMATLPKQLYKLQLSMHDLESEKLHTELCKPYHQNIE